MKIKGDEQGRLFFRFLDKLGFEQAAEITPLLSLGVELAKKIAEAIEARFTKYNYSGPVGTMRSLMKLLGIMYEQRYVNRADYVECQANKIIDDFLTTAKITPIYAIDWKNPKDVSRLFFEFRTFFFKTEDTDLSLVNRNSYWAVLVNFIEHDLIPKKILIPFIVPKPNARLSSRKNIDDAPRTITQAEDSKKGASDEQETFWDKSLTPISLSRNDEQYLDEFYIRE